MTTQLSVAVRNAQADAIETTTGTAPTLELRTGAPPANPAASDTGTVVATMTLPSDWLAAASAGVKTLLGTWQDASADATGRVGHYRIKAGATTHIQGLVSDAWQASKVYSVGDQVHNGGNLYRASAAGTSASSGGPSGTGASITDGGVTWAFVQAGTDMTLDNASVNATQQVSISAFTWTQGNA
jgi:hypothetical protein